MTTPWQLLNRVGPVTCAIEGAGPDSNGTLVIGVYGMDGRRWFDVRVSPELVAPATMIAAFQRPPVCLN